MSTIMTFPKGVFSLERHETVAIERFAYNAARAGGQILSKFEPNLALWVTFSDDPTFDVWVSLLPENGEGEVAYQINASAISPQIIFAICSEIGTKISPTHFMNDDERGKSALIESVRSLRSVFSLEGTVESRSLSHWIRSSSEALGGFSSLTSETLDLYDLVTQFIVNHEVGHAATGQLFKSASELDYEDKALEVIADLTATEWLFTRMIALTPDNEEYRKRRGLSSHSESILSNSFLVLHSLMVILGIFALAPNLTNNSPASLSGGNHHPNGYLRYIFQHVIFMTLLLTNFSEHLDDEDVHKLDGYRDYVISRFLDAEILTRSDFNDAISEHINETYFASAADYIEK